MKKEKKYFNFSEISKQFKVILIDSKEGNNTKIMLLEPKTTQPNRVKPPKKQSKLDMFMDVINKKFDLVFARLDKIEDILKRNNLK